MFPFDGEALELVQQGERLLPRSSFRLGLLS